MNNHRKRAILLGIQFILATVSAIIGLLLYNPILNGPDYLINGAEHANQVIWGAIMELILVITAIGTTITLFPLIRKQNETIAIGYLCFRFLEAIVITVGIISVLSLLTLSQEFVNAGATNAAFYQASGTLLKAVHDWTFMFGPKLFLGINTLMYSYLLYKSKLVPRIISIWGLTGATLIFIVGVLEMFGIIVPFSTAEAILAMPGVAAFEMILAGWLIVKGFNVSALASESDRTKATNYGNKPFDKVGI
ncbi:DUF4386 domain-containing protein [Paenibacillus sp. BR2-3]|uniref:DUF4386 domain-containing protein n=1 Tax=Paenibacillus sp. BR2-3 TaxID=3048494 RepID=UPI0039775395